MAALLSIERSMMGGRVGIHLRPKGDDRGAATRSAVTALGRLEAWAGRLTRFDPTSELSILNGRPGATATVRPTLAAVLDWGRAAEAATDGLVDIALLDARLAAEAGAAAALPANRRWSMTRQSRCSIVHRPAGLRFDLDGVAKGWLADRALAMLRRHPVATVDADGDVAIALAPGEEIDIGVADPAEPHMDLAVLRFRGEGPGRQICGVATSGTSIHRWGAGRTARHHLIDPRTGRPAETDLVQATIIASSARVAESFAKAAVIAGSRAAITVLDSPRVLGALLLTADRRLLVLPGTEHYLA